MGPSFAQRFGYRFGPLVSIFRYPCDRMLAQMMPYIVC